MTTIMHRTYGYSVGGVLRFWANRSLRLFPSYWLSISLSISLILLVGAEFATHYNRHLFMPIDSISWVRNILMMFLAPNPAEVAPRLSPPTWALTVELVYYLAISLGVARSLRITLVWWSVSLAYHIMTFLRGDGYDSRFFTIWAASLPFSSGAMIFFLKDVMSRFVDKVAAWGHLYLGAYFLSIACFVIGTYYLNVVEPSEDAFSIMLNIELYLSFVLIWLLLFSYAKRGCGIPRIGAKLDVVLGQYSYPMYLFHLQAGIISSFLLFGHPVRGHDLDGVGCFWGSSLILLVLCVVAVEFIEKKVELVRRRVKGGVDRGRLVETTTPNIEGASAR